MIWGKFVALFKLCKQGSRQFIWQNQVNYYKRRGSVLAANVAQMDVAGLAPTTLTKIWHTTSGSTAGRWQWWLQAGCCSMWLSHHRPCVTSIICKVTVAVSQTESLLCGGQKLLTNQESHSQSCGATAATLEGHSGWWVVNPPPPHPRPRTPKKQQIIDN